MNKRIPCIELKRSIAPWAGVMVLGAALAFLYLILGEGERSTTRWTAQWTSMALQIRGSLYFLWPLAVGLGALQGMRDHRSRMSELLASTPRPASHRAATLSAAMAIALASGFAAIVLVGGVQVLFNTEYTHLGWLPISLVGALSLVAGAVLGMGVGRALPSVFTPPALAVGILVFTTIMQMSLTKVDAATGISRTEPNLLSLLSPAAQPALDVLLTLSASVHVGQTIWLLGMAATGFALLAAGSLRNRLIALTPVLAGAVVALLVLPSDTRQVYVVDKIAAELVCEGPICVTKTHQARLNDLAGPGKDALRRMHSALKEQAPVSIREETNVWPDGSTPRWSREIALFGFDDPMIAAAKGKELSRALIANSLVPDCSPRGVEAVSVSAISAQSIAASWVLDESEPLSSDFTYFSKLQLDQVHRVWKEIKRLPQAEQRSRVSTMYLGAVACKGDPLAALDGGASR
ncbi:hypothetical protein ACFXKF_16805 [Streptomyces scopuliridis]|uniref:hypothetical protein n=2 Tax=Streptomyces scopuliridis TaxID=452529 RepID=UPI003687FA45